MSSGKQGQIHTLPRGGGGDEGGITTSNGGVARWVGGGEVGPRVGVGGGDGIGGGGGLAGEMGWDADDEGIVLVLLIKDSKLGGDIRRRRSGLDRIVKGRLGRGGRALTGHLSRSVRLLFLDAFRPDVGAWGI